MIFVEIFNDFGWFFATRIRIRFIEADPGPADQNETDPDPQHWFQRCIIIYVLYIGQNRIFLPLPLFPQPTINSYFCPPPGQKEKWFFSIIWLFY